jgi:hypothetical protein
MTRGILIVGNESALSRAIENEAAKRVEKYAVSLIPNRLTDVQQRVSHQENAHPGRFSVAWNPGSAISSRTLVLTAENKLDRIDEAILICSPPSVRRPAADLPLSDIEILINDHIKGWFFLVKEIANAFTRRGSGILGFVYFDASPEGGKDETADLLGSSSLASFRSLTAGLLGAAKREPFITMGFSSSDRTDDNGFAAHIFKTIDGADLKDSGKLHKYGRIKWRI